MTGAQLALMRDVLQAASAEHVIAREISLAAVLEHAVAIETPVTEAA